MTLKRLMSFAARMAQQLSEAPDEN